MLRVLVFNLERNNINEHFGFNIHLLKENTINIGAPEINEIKKGSNADNVGLQIGDRVIAVDGQNVSTAKEVYEIFNDKLKAKIMVERMVGGSTATKKSTDKKTTTTQIRNRAIHIENSPIPQNSISTAERQSNISAGTSAQIQPSSSRTNPSSIGIISSNRKITTDPWSLNNKINKSSPGNLPRLQMPAPSFQPKPFDADTINLNKKPKKTLAAVLGQPEDDKNTLFAHHRKKKSNYDDDEDDDEGPSYSYKSILDVCPAEGMLLSLAGRPSYSEDFRGD